MTERNSGFVKMGSTEANWAKEIKTQQAEQPSKSSKATNETVERKETISDSDRMAEAIHRYQHREIPMREVLEISALTGIVPVIPPERFVS